MQPVVLDTSPGLSCFDIIDYMIWKASETTRRVIDFVCFHQFHFCAVLAASFIAEPVTMLVTIGRVISGKFDAIAKMGANPKTLEPDQYNYRPTLLIHGNYSNEEDMAPVVDALQRKGYRGPVFTVNLEAGDVTAEDVSRVQAKVWEIFQLYAQHNPDVGLHLVGYSRGVDVINACLGPQGLGDTKIHRVTAIGSSLDAAALGRVVSEGIKVHEILARRDALCPYNSLLQSDSQTIMPSGHVGLLQYEQSLDRICQLIQA